MKRLDPVPRGDPSGTGAEAGRADPAETGPDSSLDSSLWEAFARASSPDTFCRSWLVLQCGMLQGVEAGVVVTRTSEDGRFAPAALWPDGRRDLKHLAEAAERAISERHGIVIRHPVPDAGKTPAPGAAPSQDGAETGPGGDEPTTPTTRSFPAGYHVAYPIQVNGNVHGVVALDLTPRSEAKLQTIMRQLQWGSAWLELLFRRQQEMPAKPAASDRLWTVLELVAIAVGHERFYSSATSVVTELATRLSCDRVSVGFARRGQMQVRAISHSARFTKQANLIRSIEAAMDEAYDQQATIIYPKEPDSDPEVSSAHGQLSQHHGSGSLCSVPMRSGGHIAGVLTLERPADRPFEPETVELCEALAELLGPILDSQRREDRWLIAKAADTFRDWAGRLVGPHHVALKLAVSALAFSVVFFTFATGNYRVTSKMVMEALFQRAAVAPLNGYIAEAHVRAGDLVSEGQVLCALDDRELNLERLKWQSQHEQLVKQYHQAMAERDAAQVKIFTAQIDQARAQLSLIEDQLSRTRVLAPFDGVVVTGDLSQAIGAPVERGQVLFEIAPLESYRIVLQVDERDIDEVKLDQGGNLLLTGSPSEPLPFTVNKVTPVSTAREGRNYFRVEARLHAPSDRLRPGMEGVGKIDIDRRRLIWIWTHQVTDWMRLALWRWLP